MTMNLPELTTLGETADLIASVQGDARRCAELLADLRVTTDEELQERWRPIINEGVDELVKAAAVLTAARVNMTRKGNGWQQPKPDQTIMHGLTTAARALTGLLARLEAAKADVGGRDLMVRMRSHLIGKLPPRERKAAQRRALDAQKRPLMIGGGVAGLALSGGRDG